MQDTMRLGRYSAVVALSATLGVLTVGGPMAGFTAQDEAAAPDQATEDVIYLQDGRMFRGKVLSEDDNTIRFEVQQMGQRTPLSFFKWQVLRLDRNVAKAETGDAPAGVGTADAPAAVTPKETEVDPSLPGIYVVPIRGQMGTDVLPEVYEGIVDDIRAKKPACVVFHLESDHSDYEVRDGQGKLIWEGEYREFEDYRRLIQMFRHQLPGVRQVMWVEDSVGIGSVVALAWDEIYMMPQARLDGLEFTAQQVASWQDPDVREKMKAAWSGIVKGFVELGKHDLDIAQAMMFPSYQLSADFRGREVIWELDGDGEVLVDDQDKVTAGFNAEDARNLRISQESVEQLGDDGLDDLAFVLGFREHRKIKGEAERIINDYVDAWRKTYDRVKVALADYQQYLGWAQGEDAAKFLGRGKQELVFVLNAVKRYRAVERETQREFGLDRITLELMIKDLEERIRGLNDRERGGGGAPGRPGGPGGGGGPRPG